MRVRFARDPDNSGAWGGKPQNLPQALLDRAVIDGGKELVRLMREASDNFHHYLATQ
jgi:hypothetical protein